MINKKIKVENILYETNLKFKRQNNQPSQSVSNFWNKALLEILSVIKGVQELNLFVTIIIFVILNLSDKSDIIKN